MAKALYAATFSWVVAHTNKSIQGDDASAAAAAAADGVGGAAVAAAGVNGGAEFNTDKMWVVVGVFPVVDVVSLLVAVATAFAM